MLSINYIRGVIRFEVIGIAPERFINIAIHRRLRVFGIHSENGRIYGCVSPGRFSSLADAASKAGVQLEPVEQYGLPFKLKGYRSRFGFVGGLAVFCFMTWYLSLFVWSVTTVGLPDAYAVSATDALEQSGIRTGALCSSIEGKALQFKLEHELPEFDLITISRMGCYAEIHFSPSKSIYPEVSSDIPCDIVASDGGEIVELIAENGTPLAQCGDVVYPGDVLISGLFEGSTGNINMVHSEGTVMALVERTYTETVDLKQTVAVPTGRVVTVNHIYAFGMEIPLFLSAPQGNYSVEVEQKQARLFGLDLPFIIRSERLNELCYTERCFTVEECIEQAEEIIYERWQKDGSGEIVSENQTVTEINGAVRVTKYLTLLKEISQEREILFSGSETPNE